MRLKRLLPLLLITLLAFVLVACGRGRNQEAEPTETPVAAAVAPTDTPAPAPTDTPAPQPTDTPTREPTATPEPKPTDTPVAESSAATPSAEEAGQESLFSAPADILDRFRTRGNLTIVSTLPDGSEKRQVMDIEGAYVAADNQYGSDEFVQVQVADAADTQSMAIYKIGDNVAISSDGEWITVGRDQAGLFTIMADIFTSLTDTFIASLGKADDLGVETVNGVAATRYRISDPEVFKQVMTQEGETTAPTEKILSVDMNVWVANEGNYILKYSIVADVSGATEFDDAGNEVTVDQSVNWSFEVYGIDEEIAIELPKDAPNLNAIEIPGFAEGEFPLPEGAEVSRGLLGMEIRSSLSEEEFIQFYQDALAELGWSVEGDFGFYNVSKGDVSFSMFISSDENTGETVAQVFSE